MLALLSCLFVGCAGETTDEPVSVATVPATDVPGTDAPGAGPVDPTTPDGAVLPDGFATLGARVVGPEGTCELCLWLADDPMLRRRGLMGVTDLGPADGMAFVYDAPTTSSFTMRETVLPLTIAFYGSDGRHLGTFDMEPCVAEPCTSYPTPADFTVAIEVPRGRAGDLGLVAGSRLELGGSGCDTPSSH